MTFLQRFFSILAVALYVMLSTVTNHAQAAEATYDRVMASKTIRCGYFTWPPYITKDSNTGKLSGINYDIMEAIGKNLGLKIEWAAEIGVGDVVAGLEANKADVMCATVWPNAGRTQNLTLTKPTFYSIAYAFVRADDKRFDGDLSKANNKDIKVSGIDGDITADLAIEKLPSATHAFLPQTASGSEILLQLMTKKADIALVDEGMVNDFMKTNPGTLRKVANVAPARIFGEHLPVRRGEYHLRDMLDVSIQQLVNDGLMDELVKKYRKEYNAVFIAPTRTFVAE